MPCVLKVRIIQAYDLPVMDRTTELSDAFVEVKFSDIPSQKTEIFRKSLNPVWNQDFRFEVREESTLQDVPLELKVWDYDIVSANDLIGVVLIDFNPVLTKALLNPENPGTSESDASPSLSGTFPIFDTIRGCRGFLQVAVKIEFIQNINPFKDSSTGVSFYNGTNPPFYTITKVFGIVDELIMEVDPEYQWTIVLRKSRNSNEERLILMYRLMGKVRRKIGSKVLQLGGNAVLGYHLQFDLEGETGLVARGYGTACILSRPQPYVSPDVFFSSPATETATAPISLHHSPTPSPTGLSGTSGSVHDNINQPLLAQGIFTLTSAPDNVFLVSIGGLVAAHAVKLLKSSHSASDRSFWWDNLREEVKEHALSLNCLHVLGYTESTAIFEEENLVILSGIGTAANLASSVPSCIQGQKVSSYISPRTLETTPLASGPSLPTTPQRLVAASSTSPCGWCHVPYETLEQASPMKLSPCKLCGKYKVPEFLLTSIELPSNAPLKGPGKFLEARVCRAKRKEKGRENAALVSDALTFLQYDLHRQLIHKLLVLGMNSAFRVRLNVSIGDTLIVGMATCTAVYLLALPPPRALKINRSLEVLDEEDRNLVDIQNQIEAFTERDATHPEETTHDYYIEPKTLSFKKMNTEPEEDIIGTKKQQQPVFVPVDDEIDEDFMAILLDPPLPNGVEVYSTEMPPTSETLSPILNTAPEYFSAIKRVKWKEKTQLNQRLRALCLSLMDSVIYKLRFDVPFCLTNVKNVVELPAENEIQVLLTGTIQKLESSSKLSTSLHEKEQLHVDPSFPKTTDNFSSETKGIIIDTDNEEQLVFDIDIENKEVQKKTARLTIKEEKSKPINSRLLNKAVRISSTSQFIDTSISSAQYLGHIQRIFIRETFGFKVHGGMGAFLHSFLQEALIVIRSQVVALGGNALLSLKINKFKINQNRQKQQGYCVLSLSGDAYASV